MGKSARKPKLSRSELIFCGVLLLGAVGFGIYRLDQAVYKMREPQIFEEATQTVSPGETLSLTYREVGRECNYIPWNGVVEMTIQKVALYASYTDAQNAGENVENPNGLLHDINDPFLIIEVDVKNIDAEEGDYQWRYNNISESDGAITLQDALFSLYLDAPINDSNHYDSDRYLGSSLWCVNGISSAEYSNTVDIPQGDTVHVTLGYSLEDSIKDYLDGAALIYAMPYDRMLIGSPTLGGEADAVVSQ